MAAAVKATTPGIETNFLLAMEATSIKLSQKTARKTSRAAINTSAESSRDFVSHESGPKRNSDEVVKNSADCPVANTPPDP